MCCTERSTLYVRLYVSQMWYFICVLICVPNVVPYMCAYMCPKCVCVVPSEPPLFGVLTDSNLRSIQCVQMCVCCTERSTLYVRLYVRLYVCLCVCVLYRANDLSCAG